MSKIFRVHTRFVPKSSESSVYAALLPGDYQLEEVQPEEGIRVISRNKTVSIYVSAKEAELHGSIVESEFTPVECELHTLEEIANIAEHATGGISLSPKSAGRLSDLLKELADCRKAIRAAREGLAKAKVW